MNKFSNGTRWLAVSMAVVLVSVCVAGCPQPEQDPVLSVSPRHVVLGASEDTGAVQINNRGEGRLNWSASSSVEWLEITTASGTNRGVLTFSADRSGLAPGQHEASISVQSAGGSATITVTVYVDAGASESMWPLAVGNSWSFAAADMYVNDEDWNGDWKSLNSRDTVLVLTVTDQLSVGGHDVWQVDIVSPLMDFMYLPGFGPYDPNGNDYFYKSSAPLQQLVYGAPLPSAIATYWVFLGGGWHIALSPEAVADLPDTSRLFRWSQIERLLAKGLYAVLSHDGHDFLAELESIESRLTDDLSPLLDELDDYLENVLMGSTEELMAFLAAYGGAFNSYTNDSALLTGLVRLSASLASGAPKVESFLGDALIIAAAFEELHFEYGEDLDAYMDALVDDNQPLVDMLEALGVDFSDYEHQEQWIQDFVQLCATVAASAQDIADFTLAAEEVIALTGETLDDQFWDSYWAYMDAQMDDPQGIADLLEAFGAAFTTYENPDTAVRGFGRILGATAEGSATIARNLSGYTAEDYAALDQFAIELTLFVESRGVESLIDPIHFLDELTAFVSGYQTDSQAVEDAIQLVQEVAPHLRTLIIELDTAEDPLGDRDDLFLFVNDLHVFFAGYSAANPGDELAFLLSVSIGALDDILDLTDEYLGDMLDQVREDLEILLANLETIDEAQFDPVNTEELMADLHAWFTVYAVLHPDDVLAAYLGEVTGLAADFMGLVDRDLGWVFDDFLPQLGDFVRGIGNLPEGDVSMARVRTLLNDLASWHGDYGAASGDPLATAIGLFAGASAEIVGETEAFLALLESIQIRQATGALNGFMPSQYGPMGEVTLGDIAVGDQPDCVATEIFVDGPEHANVWLPVAIYSEGLGPVMFGPITLEHAVVDGVEYGK